MISAVALALALAATPAADPYERVEPVLAPQEPRREAGYYRNKETGVVMYFDGCNWCSTFGQGGTACTSLACPSPAIVGWKPVVAAPIVNGVAQ